MFGSTALDVGIGIVLVYLLLSIVVTSAKEGVATLFHHRGKFLSGGIEKLLNATAPAPVHWLKWPFSGPAWGSNTGLAQSFFQHPLIRPFWTDEKKPPYIYPETFSKVLLELLRTGNAPPVALAPQDTASPLREIQNGLDRPEIKAIRQPLISLFNAAQINATSDARKLEKQIETWFNHTMDQVSAAYKRHTQVLCFLIALFFICLLNIDTIDICRQLSKEPAMRAALVEAAKSRVAKGAPKPATESDKDSLSSLVDVMKETGELTNLGIPLGWSSWQFSVGGIISKLLGLVMTACAATLGAPFWFDVLNKFMSVRGVGKAPNEESKSPKTEPAR
jgi:hypothetical protein